jgi:hypothetical protein
MLWSECVAGGGPVKRLAGTKTAREPIAIFQIEEGLYGKRNKSRQVVAVAPS